MSASEPPDSAPARPTGGQTSALSEREDNELYQGGRRVALVVDPKVDADCREIHFEELYQSDDLLMPDDCEFRNYRILIQKVGFASRQESGAAHKGRVLKNVTAEILGYRQQ